ncbi:hypothetical protein CDAR_424691 [Caerostris darwini]|uniref:Uncharacterized protein n=1 Tax=Caerostris darwini TaxID=1538125 RepID=A0AAV4RQT2_9ARAC|nr:hypothetical protein CDAR_424691 [Caerostris darwini]
MENLQEDRSRQTYYRNIPQRTTTPQSNSQLTTAAKILHHIKSSLPNIYNNNGNHFPGDHSKHNYRNNNPQPTMVSSLNNEQLPVTETLDSTTKPFPNRNNMNKKYHHDIRTSHTYRTNIPQTITAPNLNNAQYSTTEIAQRTKPLSQKNLPAFIFTINSSPEHLNPNWKSGQKYNPPQVYEPASTLSSQTKQRKSGKITII